MFVIELLVVVDDLKIYSCLRHVTRSLFSVLLKSHIHQLIAVQNLLFSKLYDYDLNICGRL